MKEKDKLQGKMTDIDQTGMKEMICSTKIGILDHLKGMRGLRKDLRRQMVKRRKRLIRNLKVRLLASSAERKVIFLVSVRQRCQKLRSLRGSYI